jgi:hypothetical protein
MNRLRSTPRRRIATTALLLASFLEICGCNPVRSCEQLRATRLSAIPWETLIEQCARCLSARELMVLRQVQEESVVYSVANEVLEDTTVQETLEEVHGPAFDVPFERASGDSARVHDDPTTAGGYDNLRESSESAAETKPIAWPIPNSVLFLYASAPLPGEAARRIATGFILSLPGESLGTSKFLVTARHVVDPEWARCGSQNPKNITIRLNRRAGGVSYRTIALERDHLRQFVTSADEETDLALIPLGREDLPDLDEFKVADTPLDTLPTEHELSRMHEAQQIATVGVAQPKLAGLMDLPISESGMIVSAANGALVPVRCAVESPAKSIRMLLIEADVGRGLSGAPVYAAFSRGPHHVSTPLLVGIQTVVWPDRGEAGITPVAALLEMVEEMAETRGDPSRLAMNSREAPPG